MSSRFLFFLPVGPCYEDSEYGSIPAIVVIWDDSETGYPEDYIQKCVEAFERFDLPEEIHQAGTREGALAS